MMGKKIHKILFMFLLFLVACQQTPSTSQAALCNSPYFEWQKGQCCLDTDSNRICDEHETVPKPIILTQSSEQANISKNMSAPDFNKTEVKTALPKNKTLMQELIEKTPKSYFFWNFDDGAGALVVGNRRSDGYVEHQFAGILAPMSWDVNTKRILQTAPLQIDERWYNLKHNLPPPKTTTGQIKYFPAYFEFNLTGDPEIDLHRIPPEIAKYYWMGGMEDKVRSEKYRGDRLRLIFFSAFHTKGPVDIMKEYALEQPVSIYTKPIMISPAGKQITVNLSISFKKKGDPTKTLVFRIHPKYFMPVQIDELDSRLSLIKRTEFDVETTVTYQGKKNTPISEKFVEPLPGYILVTTQEIDEYKEAIESGGWSEFFENKR